MRRLALFCGGGLVCTGDASSVDAETRVGGSSRFFGLRFVFATRAALGGVGGFLLLVKKSVMERCCDIVSKARAASTSRSLPFHTRAALHERPTSFRAARLPESRFWAGRGPLREAGEKRAVNRLCAAKSRAGFAQTFVRIEAKVPTLRAWPACPAAATQARRVLNNQRANRRRRIRTPRYAPIRWF